VLNYPIAIILVIAFGFMVALVTTYTLKRGVNTDRLYGHDEIYLQYDPRCDDYVVISCHTESVLTQVHYCKMAYSDGRLAKTPKYASKREAYMSVMDNIQYDMEQ